MTSMSSPLPTPNGSNIELPLFAGVGTQENEQTESLLITPTPRWRRFSFLKSPGLPFTPPPQYVERTEGTRLQSIIRQSYQDFALGACAIPCCFITLLYAYGATLGSLSLQGLYRDTSFTIFLLWVLSQLSVFLVRQLVSSTFERMRWALASGGNGILIANFLGMSPATTLSGVLRLLIFSGDGTHRGNIWSKVSKKVQWWIAQRFYRIHYSTKFRLLFLLLQIGLGVLLFTHLAFEDVYPIYVTRPVLSGLPEFNVTARFGNGLLNDYLRRVSIQKFALAPIAPYRLSFPMNKHEVSADCNASCSAVRIHANIEYTVVLPYAWKRGETIPEIKPNWKSAFDPTHQWTNFKVHNASTLQMEASFQNVSATDIFLHNECQTYGYPYLAVRMCLKQGAKPHHLIAAGAACERVDQHDCFTNHTWTTQMTRPANISLHRLNSEIVYDRKNGNILSSKKVAPLLPTSWDREGLFSFYNNTYGIADINDDTPRPPEVVTTIKYHTVLQAAEFLLGDVSVNGAQGDEDQYWRNFAVMSLVMEPYEDAINNISDRFFASASTAIQLPRATIPPIHLIGFGIITTFSLVWWLTLMRWLVRRNVAAPNTSAYPEIDFGSKCVQGEDAWRSSSETGEGEEFERIEGLAEVLLPLSNATSSQIEKEIESVRMYLGSARKTVQGSAHILLTTNVNEVDDLVVGMKYS